MATKPLSQSHPKIVCLSISAYECIFDILTKCVRAHAHTQHQKCVWTVVIFGGGAVAAFVSSLAVCALLLLSLSSYLFSSKKDKTQLLTVILVVLSFSLSFDALHNRSSIDQYTVCVSVTVYTVRSTARRHTLNCSFLNSVLNVFSCGRRVSICVCVCDLWTRYHHLKAFIPLWKSHSQFQSDGLRCTAR